jgi:hypothetical protein
MLWIWGGKPEWLADFLEVARVPKLLCFFYGHVAERDQCNRPEHDYCVYCNKGMPNSWKPESK